MLASFLGCVLLVTIALGGGSAHARDWRAPEPWPEGAPRVLVIGDSNLYGPIGEVVQEGLVASGYAVWRRGRPSTGLSRPDRFDWFEQARGMIDEARPAVIITQFGGNDVLYLRFRGDRKRRVPFRDEAAWSREYGARVRDFLSLLAGDGRRVVLLSPTNRGLGLAEVERVRAVQREAAGAVAGVTFVDMFPLTSDEQGRWLRAVVEDGRRVVVRRWDTVHFNEAGGAVVGARVLEVLRGIGLVR